MDCALAEPEEEEQAVEHDQAEQQERPHRQKGQAGGLESIQIEEVSLQEAKHDSEAHSSPGKDEGTGMMQSVMGAAKSLFGGGKTDEQVCLIRTPCFPSSHTVLLL